MSSLRVIGGTARGCKLQLVPGDSTRPITDRVKEALFNIIGADIYDANFLDLFGGTGSVGIEALSRGASSARFIDNQRLAVKTIKANLQKARVAEKAAVMMMDAFTFLRLDSLIQSYDYIYVAPPQYKEIWKHIMVEIDNRPSLLSPDGWVIVQIDPKEYEPVQFANLQEFDQRRYGNTSLVFYKIRLM